VVARCPECQARYRIAREKIGARGARIRCAQCQTIFKIDAPQAPVSAPEPVSAKAQEAVARMIVAEGDAATAKAISDFLQTRRIEGVIVSDGGEAILQIHRTQPDGVILGGQLPGLNGSALAEIVRRTAELASVRLIRIATLEEPVGAPEFEAEHTLEPGDLPDGLGPILERLQIGEKPAIAQGPPEPQEQPASDPASESSAAPEAAPVSEPKGRRSRGQPTSSDPEVAAAERLARIIVSDIILYNDEKFGRGVEEGNVVQLLQAELEEASTLFKQRIPEAIRAGRDFLSQELERRAEAKKSS